MGNNVLMQSVKVLNFQALVRGVVNKFPDWWLKTQKGLPKTLGAGITFKVVPFCGLTMIPAALPVFEAFLEVIFS